MNDRPVELAEALARLPSASLPVVVTEARPPFVITHVNAAWEQACGYTAAEALGRTCRMLQGRQTDASLLGPLRDAVLASKTHAVQLVNYRKDGTAFRNALSLQPVRGHRGDVTHYIGTLKVTPLEEERASGAPLVVPPRRRRCPIIASAVGTAAGARAAEPTPVPPLPTQMALQPASVTAAALPPERARPAEHGAPPRDAALPDAPMPDADADDAAAHVKRARAPPSHQGTPPSHVAAGLPPEAQPADDGGESARDGENDSGSTDSRGARPNKTQRPSDAVHDSGTSPPADAQPQPASRAQQQQQQQAADGEDAVMEDAGGGDTAVAEPMRDATPAAQRPVAQQPAQAPAAGAQPAGAQETREVVNADLSRFSMPLTLDAALRVVGEVLVVTEPHPPFRIVHVNDAWTALCGWRRDEIIGKTCAVLQGPGTCRQVLAKLSEAVSQNQSITVMVLNYTRARRPFMNMLCVAPLSDAAGERPSHYAGISRPQFLTSLLPSMERVMASLMPPASTAVSSPLPATPADASAQALVPSSSAAASAGAPALEQQDVMALAATVAAAGRLPESVRASLRPLLDAVGSAPTHSPPVATERSGEPVASSSRGNVSSRAREPSACMSDPRGGNPSTSHDAGGSLSDAAAVVKLRIAPFVLKLYDMVCSSATDYCIRWAPSGKSFVINDTDQLASEVLPNYFKHNQLTSFTQQLSTYSFARFANPSCLDARLEFAHRDFTRELGRERLHLIRRPSKLRAASRQRDASMPVSGSTLRAPSPSTVGVATGGGPASGSGGVYSGAVGAHGHEAEQLVVRTPHTATEVALAMGGVNRPRRALYTSNAQQQHALWVQEMTAMLNELEDRFQRTKEQHLLAEESLEMLILQIAKKLVTRSARYSSDERGARRRGALGMHAADANENRSPVGVRPEPTSTASAQGKRSGSEPRSTGVGSGGSGGTGSGGSGSKDPSEGDGSKGGSEGEGSGGEGSDH